MSHCQRLKESSCFDSSGWGVCVGCVFQAQGKKDPPTVLFVTLSGVGGENAGKGGGGTGGGVTSACIVCVRKVGLAGWRLLQDCCCVDLLSQSGPCGPDFKPYLRGLGTDGLPLLQNAYIQKWTEKVLPVSSSLNKPNHSHFYANYSS